MYLTHSLFYIYTLGLGHMGLHRETFVNFFKYIESNIRLELMILKKSLEILIVNVRL